MITRIQGTETTKKMVINAVESMRKIRPDARHIDYEVLLNNKRGYSSLSTFEDNKQLRNISQISISNSQLFSGIKAVIGNKTGNVDIERVPLFMSVKKATRKINSFLELLQPENRVNPISEGPLPVDFPNMIKTQETFKKYQLQTTIHPSDRITERESVPRYRTL